MLGYWLALGLLPLGTRVALLDMEFLLLGIIVRSGGASQQSENFRVVVPRPVPSFSRHFRSEVP